MADSEQQVVLIDAANLAESGQIVTVNDEQSVQGGGVSDDILQQALEEASQGFDDNIVEYGEESTIVADGSQHTLDADSVENVNTAVYSIVSSTEDASATHAIQQVPVQETVQGNVVHTDENGAQYVSVESGMAVGNPITVVSTNHQATPLGSSANPIRIVQQGNQYTSMQQLSGDQLSQIMQVVQQQQLAKTTAEGGGSTVLFNPSTQTRIVYRVIYPSELHSKGITIANAQTVSNVDGNQMQVPKQMVFVTGEEHQALQQKRTYRKRNREEDEKVDGPELSREEKEQRKKHRPRTRSGRVSRPPKHMVQDYKHIHPVDWDEDYDDSDGGYSDFKESDGEHEGETKEKEVADDLIFQIGLPQSKPKTHQCLACSKAYIGQAGLARHMRLNPSHATPGGAQLNGASHGNPARKYVRTIRRLKKTVASLMDQGVYVAAVWVDKQHGHALRSAGSKSLLKKLNTENLENAQLEGQPSQKKCRTKLPWTDANDILEMKKKDLRRAVAEMVKLDQETGKIMYNMKCPCWWPQDVPFADIQKHLSKPHLMKAASNGLKYFQARGHSRKSFIKGSRGEPPGGADIVESCNYVSATKRPSSENNPASQILHVEVMSGNHGESRRAADIVESCNYVGTTKRPSTENNPTSQILHVEFMSNDKSEEDEEVATEYKVKEEPAEVVIQVEVTDEDHCYATV